MRPNILYSLELSFQKMWIEITQFLPEILLALLMVLIGWMLGSILKAAVEKLFTSLNIDGALKAANVDDLVAKTGYKLKSGEFVGTLMKWFVIIVFFVVALDILRLDQVTIFFRDVVLGYLPKVIVAVLILLVATAIANVSGKSVTGAAKAAGFKAADLVGSLTRYAILVFAVLAAMNQLEIAPELVQTLFMGIVFATALATGLAFGLGGKNAASKYIESITETGKSSDYDQGSTYD